MSSRTGPVISSSLACRRTCASADSHVVTAVLSVLTAVLLGRVRERPSLGGAARDLTGGGPPLGGEPVGDDSLPWPHGDVLAPDLGAVAVAGAHLADHRGACVLRHLEAHLDGAVVHDLVAEHAHPGAP